VGVFARESVPFGTPEAVTSKVGNSLLELRREQRFAKVEDGAKTVISITNSLQLVLDQNRELVFRKRVQNLETQLRDVTLGPSDLLLDRG
jgi:hypothetical protein